MSATSDSDHLRSRWWTRVVAAVVVIAVASGVAVAVAVSDRSSRSTATKANPGGGETVHRSPSTASPRAPTPRTTSTTAHGVAPAVGSTLRLQQLLGELGYLPVTFTPTAGTARPDNGTASQPGRFSWRWPHPSPHLVGLWAKGADGVVTKAAVMSFEKQAGLAVDGVAGPNVWKQLLADKTANRADPSPYTYVLVTKTRPEHLTIWDNGTVELGDIPVNTGLPGAPTTDGSYPVFEHVSASDMKGTNPDGSTYNDKNVPWASFFDGGEALHGFVRATYGFPQSNGCVEMSISNAAKLWPSTPIGTLVTVTGPNAT